MKPLCFGALLVLLAAGSSFAQSSSPSSRMYAGFSGGVAVSPDATSGDVLGEFGVRVARNISVFGNIGQFHNLQPSQLQPTVLSTDTALSGDGATVSGTARVPALYGMGGVRWSVPVPTTKISPYVFGGAGFAHLTPTADFTFTGGAIPGALTAPTAGTDVTSQLMSLGDYTQPASENAFMFAVGGGIEAPIADHLVANVGYRISRIDADTPLNAQSVIFGVGYRF